LDDYSHSPVVDYASCLGAPEMFGNDVWSCCTRASWANLLRVWTKLAWGDELVTPTDVVLSDFVAEGGTKDTGLPEAKMLKRWATLGCPFPSRQFIDMIEGWAPIDISEPDHLKVAIEQCVGICAGFALPKIAMQQTNEGVPWDINGPLVGDAAWGSLGGHEVAMVGYDEAKGLWTVLTWEKSGNGVFQQVTERFRAAYMDEADAPMSRTIFGTQAKSPKGLDWNQLRSVMEEVRKG
jgi:hypothetical protein